MNEKMKAELIALAGPEAVRWSAARLKVLAEQVELAKAGHYHGRCDGLAARETRIARLRRRRAEDLREPQALTQFKAVKVHATMTQPGVQVSFAEFEARELLPRTEGGAGRETFAHHYLVHTDGAVMQLLGHDETGMDGPGICSIIYVGGLGPEGAVADPFPFAQTEKLHQLKELIEERIALAREGDA